MPTSARNFLRNGVNKKLLRTEYLEECRLSGDEPLMYSQFCYYIQQDELKRRATMHINRKPAEQVEVDWAGDPAYITDPDTGEIINAYLFVGVMTYSQYPYVEAFIDEKQPSWIAAHVLYICMNTSAGLPRFWCLITAVQRLTITKAGKTSGSILFIRKWLNTMALPSSPPVSGLLRTSQTPRAVWEISLHGSPQPYAMNSSSLWVN